MLPDMSKTPENRPSHAQTSSAAPDDTVRFVNMARPDQIAAAIDTLLLDPKAANEQERRAREHAQKIYCAAQIWPRLEQFYLSRIEKTS